MLNEPSDVTSEFTVVKGGNRRRLLWRISVRVLPLAFAMVVVAQVFIGYLNYTENFNQLQTRVDLLAHLQSRALQLPMWNMDSQLIDTMIRALEQDPDFISAKVLDARGEVAFKNERERNPGNRPVSASASIVFSDSQQSRQLGELQISLSSETLDQTLFRQILAILAAALILIIGYSAALFSALNATVFKPLDLLLGGMAEVGRHRWVTVQWPALDEIGELVGAFNHMVAGLRAGEDARQALRDREERYAIAVADEARADAANRAKSEFLAKMSHELRTPLNAIGNYCLLIKEELADLGQSHLMDDLGNIESSSRHLLSIINDVLDLSKIEAGYMELLYEKVDVAEFIRETRLMSISLSERNRNSFVLDMQDDLGEMVTDSTRLRQSILNLISNAVKFTSDGTVTLKVRADESWVIISLSDTGIGMTQAQIGRIFEPFIQADASTTKRFGGTGLGLALTRTFVTMLGGAIDVTSEYGKGSTFRIMLPRDSANQQLPTVPSGQKQVLVLASEDAPITEFARALKADGHKVIQVVTAAALERAVLESKPDLIVAKINNDSFDASKLRDFIRTNQSVKNIPVLGLALSDVAVTRSMVTSVDHGNVTMDSGLLTETVRRYLTSDPTGTVLVVDDDRGSRSFLSRAVENLNLSVAEAVDGAEGLALFGELLPDLVILDLQMPTLDGRRFIQRLRELPQGKLTPVILATAKDLTGEEADLLLRYCDQIILKGNFTREQLMDNIRYWMAKGQAQKAIEVN